MSTTRQESGETSKRRADMTLVKTWEGTDEDEGEDRRGRKILQALACYGCWAEYDIQLPNRAVGVIFYLLSLCSLSCFSGI
jgi:hypothetical protein